MVLLFWCYCSVTSVVVVLLGSVAMRGAGCVGRVHRWQKNLQPTIPGSQGRGTLCALPHVHCLVCVICLRFFMCCRCIYFCFFLFIYIIIFYIMIRVNIFALFSYLCYICIFSFATSTHYLPPTRITLTCGVSPVTALC